RLAIIAAPAALTGGVVQINLLVGRQVASFTEGAIVWLSLADRLYQLPLGMVGIAMGIVLLPDLSRRLQAGDSPGGAVQINRAIEFSALLILPATAALIVLAEPLVSVLFGHGVFTDADVLATAAAVTIYGAGLPAFVLQKIFSPVFFAREDTRTPFRYALVSMVANAVIAIGLAPVVGYLAAAIGTTVSGWIMLALLWSGARRIEGAVTFDDRLRLRLPRILFAAVVMAAACTLAAAPLAGALDLAGWRYLALAALVLTGIGTFGASAVALGVLRPDEIRSALGRG
ncbi:MAG: lipid II flippase MurJ, partial [Pseudomonadota bacterium]